MIYLSPLRFQKLKSSFLLLIETLFEMMCCQWRIRISQTGGGGGGQPEGTGANLFMAI